MSEEKALDLRIIASSDRIILRGWLAQDVEYYLRWLIQGEWRLLDAPWFGYKTSMTIEDEKRTRKWFANQLNGDPESWLNKRSVIATPDSTPLGWVSRYSKKNHPNVWFVGISICEDTYLNRGLGTESLRLWINHLFTVSDVHKLGLETWSFNPRMIRSAEKVGFVCEGRLREVRQWQGEWLDLIQFGLLREEWQTNG